MSGLGLGLGFRVRVRVRFRFGFRCPSGKCPSGMSPSGTCQSGTCPRSVLKYTICHIICFLPLNLCGIPNFELGILLFVTSQECSKISALLLA